MSEKESRLSDETRAAEVFGRLLDWERATQLQSCVRCGLCAESCHYYLADREVRSIPAYKVGLVQRVFQRYFRRNGRLISPWVGGQSLNRATLEEWVQVLFGRCSLCGRCSLNCPMGLKIHTLIRLGRSLLSEFELIPSGLNSTLKTALASDNNMGIKTEEWVETVRWLEEELRADLADPSASMPIDVAGARVLYAINPREAKFFPLSLLAAAKIFKAAGESWTLTSTNYDVTNYGYFSGSDQLAATFFSRLEASMKRLGAKVLVLAECGHGYSSARWEAPWWKGSAVDFEVKSILEVMADYVKTGRIRLDPSRNPQVHTLHDPCNLVRLGGIVEEQRYLLRQACSVFVEMTPNREENFCCGGGGGQLAMSEFASLRVKVGQIKAEQIKKTKAKVVVAPCHNCLDQLLELNRVYKLGVQLKTVAEVVADALVL